MKTLRLDDPQEVNSKEEAYKVQESVLKAKEDGYTHVEEYVTSLDMVFIYPIDEAIKEFTVR